MTERSPKKSSSVTSTSVRPHVRALLESSPAYRELPPEKRREIAQNTVRVSSYLADPDRLVSQEFANPVLAPNDLLGATNFPKFVGDLVYGVFGSIVNASVKQMEAYAKLVAHAAESASDFAADKISPNRARDELVSKFPQIIHRSARGRLQLAADRAAVAQIASTVGLRRPLSHASASAGLATLVLATRRRIARERQKELALALSMGINRIMAAGGQSAKRRTGKTR